MTDFSPSLSSLQGLVVLLLGLAAFVLQVYALFDVLRQRSAAFPAAGKQTKKLWLVLLVVAAAIGFVSIGPTFGGPLNIFNLLAVVAAGVYLADVRPAVSGSGRPGNYGNW